MKIQLSQKAAQARLWTKENISTAAIILLPIALLSGVIHLISIFSESFADFFNFRIAGFYRLITARLTGIYPGSLGEIITILAPILAIALVVFIFYHAKKEHFKLLYRTLSGVLALLFFLYASFVFTLGTGYHTTELDERLGLNRTELSAAQLKEVSLWLAEKVNEYVNEVDYIDESVSVMPYSFKVMNEKLCDAYKKAAEKYDFIMGYSSVVKPVLSSKFLSKAGMLGMYNYYTGETNVNVDYYDYNLVFTTAHEMSHQRGISREDEANFMAFLVCLESDDPYINYCGYLSMFEYMLNPLYASLKAIDDTATYSRVVYTLDEHALNDIGMSNKKTVEQQGTVSNIFNKVNDTYIKIQGDKDGTESYGLVVELTAAAYYAKYFQSQQ